MIDTFMEALLSPEQAVVLNAIRVDRGSSQDLQQILAGRVDWPLVQQFALRHGVLPQIYACFKSLENELTPGLIPVEIMKELQVFYLTNAQRNLRLSLTLLRVLGLLSEAGIQGLPIKGPVLAEQLYGDTSLRQFTDLDILIRARDFHRVYRKLILAGLNPGFSLDEKSESWLVRTETEYPFFYQEDLLEVHWAIAEKGTQYPIRENQLWHKLHKVTLNGKNLTSLSLENLFLLLCIHGTKHMWSRLIWVSDIAHFVKSYPGVGWDDIVDHAEQLGFSRIVCLGLRMGEQIGGVQLPGSIRERIRSDPNVEQLAREALQFQLDSAPASEGKLVKYYLRSRERNWDRIYYVLDQTFVPKQVDWLSVSLPAVFYPLYYLFRPLRLFYKFLQS